MQDGEPREETQEQNLDEESTHNLFEETNDEGGGIQDANLVEMMAEEGDEADEEPDFGDALFEVDIILNSLEVEVKKEEKIVKITEKDEQEESKISEIKFVEIEKFVYETNLEAFIYFQSMDITYCYYSLRKCSKILQKLKEDYKLYLDETILIDNNIAFLFSKIGMPERSVPLLVDLVQQIENKCLKDQDKQKKSSIFKPDYLTQRCQSIKYSKIRSRLYLSLCVLHSEQLLHDKALEYANQSLNLLIGLVYDSYFLCYHLLLKNDKEGSKSKSTASSTKDTLRSEGGLQQQKESENQEREEQSTKIQDEDKKYLQVLLLIFKDVLERIKDLEFDYSDKKKTIILLEKLYQQIVARDNSKMRKIKISEKVDPESLLHPEQVDLSYIYDSYYPAHWLMSATILNIAQIQFLTSDDVLFMETTVHEEVCPEIIVEKLSLLTVCFYAISTEYRFKERFEEFKLAFGKTKTANSTPVQEKKGAEQEGIGSAVVARFSNISLQKKLPEAIEEKKREQSALQKMKQNAFKNIVNKSECYLGRAIELSFSYLNHDMPFVTQIFNVFKKFQLSYTAIIPENEEINERCIYLKSLKGGFKSNFLMPLVRRSMTEKYKKSLYFSRKRDLSTGNSIDRKSKRDSSLKRRSIKDRNSLSRKRDEKGKSIVTTKNFVFSRTDTNFGQKKNKNNAPSERNKKRVKKNNQKYSGQYREQEVQNNSEVPQRPSTNYRIKEKGVGIVKRRKRNVPGNINGNQEIQNPQFAQQTKQEQLLNGIFTINGTVKTSKTHSSGFYPSPSGIQNPQNERVELHISNINNLNVYLGSSHLNNQAMPSDINGDNNLVLSQFDDRRGEGTPQIEEFYKGKSAIESLSFGQTLINPPSHSQSKTYKIVVPNSSRKTYSSQSQAKYSNKRHDRHRRRVNRKKTSEMRNNQQKPRKISKINMNPRTMNLIGTSNNSQSSNMRSSYQGPIKKNTFIMPKIQNSRNSNNLKNQDFQMNQSSNNSSFLNHSHTSKSGKYSSPKNKTSNNFRSSTKNHSINTGISGLGISNINTNSISNQAIKGKGVRVGKPYLKEISRNQSKYKNGNNQFTY